MKIRVGSVVVGLTAVVCLLAFLGCAEEKRSSGSNISGLSDQPNACTLAGLTEPLLDPAPVFYRSKGKPVTETLSFSVPMDGELCVVVTNGDGDPPHGHRISAARISIDGELVIGPEPFDQNTAEIIAPHTVTAGTHELSVKLASKPGSFISIQLMLLTKEENAPVLSIAEDHLSTDQESIQFNVDIYDETAIDTSSFQAFLEGNDVSSSFFVSQTGAVSVALSLPIIGANNITVGVSDIFGNYGETTGYVYRGEPGELPDAFGVIKPGVGGEVEVTDPSSSVFGAAIVIPPGAVETEQTVTIGSTSEYYGSPEGLVAVGPPVEFGPDIAFSVDVTVRLPFSESLLKPFRSEKKDVEVWRYHGVWERTGGEIVEPEASIVSVETDTFSPLQAWIDYPDNLVMETVVGGGSASIPCCAPVLNESLDVELPTSVTVSPNGTIYFNERIKSSIDRLDGLLVRNVRYSDSSQQPPAQREKYSSIAYHQGDGRYLYYAAEVWDIPCDTCPHRIYGLIKRLNLDLNEEELIGGNPYGDPTTDGIPASNVLIGLVQGISVDYYGNIYYAEFMGGFPFEGAGARVRKIDGNTYNVTTVAGTGEPGFDPEIGDTTPFDARLVRLDYPWNANVDGLRVNGELLFIADTNNNRVRAVNTTDHDVTFGPENNQITLKEHEMISVIGFDKNVDAPFPMCSQWITQDGQDGRATGIFRPHALSLSEDILFVTDMCDRILIMSLDDLSVTRIAGIVGEGGYNGDGNVGIETKLDKPLGIAYDNSRSELLIADSVNARVRRIKYKWRIYVSPDGNDELGPEDGAGSAEHPIRTIQRAQTLIEEVKGGAIPPPDDDIEILVAPGSYYGKGNFTWDDPRDHAEVIWTYSMPEHSISIKAQDPSDPPRFFGCEPIPEGADPSDYCYDREFGEYCGSNESLEDLCKSCEDNWIPECEVCIECNINSNKCHCTWLGNLVADRRRQGVWFYLSSEQGRASNIHFENIEIRDYQDGITFRGAAGDPGKWNGHNSVINCVFETLGSQFVEDFQRPWTAVGSKARYGYSGIGIANSRNNLVANNFFNNLVDTYNIYGPNDPAPIHVHGVYLSWFSSGNHIFNNVFHMVSGDPVRIRDFCNFNEIHGNLFSRSGFKAAYGTWFCDCSKRDDCFKDGCKDGSTHPLYYIECPSYENHFYDNILDSAYEKDLGLCRSLDEKYLEPLPNNDYMYICCHSPNNKWAPLPCDPGSQYDEWERAYSYGNISTDYPCQCANPLDIRTVDDCRNLLE